MDVPGVSLKIYIISVIRLIYVNMKKTIHLIPSSTYGSLGRAGQNNFADVPHPLVLVNCLLKLNTYFN